jgi:hypothetical protein
LAHSPALAGSGCGRAFSHSQSGAVPTPHRFLVPSLGQNPGLPLAHPSALHFFRWPPVQRLSPFFSSTLWRERFNSRVFINIMERGKQTFFYFFFNNLLTASLAAFPPRRELAGTAPRNSDYLVGGAARTRTAGKGAGPECGPCATTRVQISFSWTLIFARPCAVGGRLAVPSVYIAAEPRGVGAPLVDALAEDGTRPAPTSTW